MLQERIEKLDRASACLVENPKKVIQKGITRPPPPMPPTVEIDDIMIKRVRPTNSEPSIGKTSLCKQLPICCSFVLAST
jgi:hypothetical protein